MSRRGLSCCPKPRDESVRDGAPATPEYAFDSDVRRLHAAVETLHAEVTRLGTALDRRTQRLDAACSELEAGRQNLSTQVVCDRESLSALSAAAQETSAQIATLAENGRHVEESFQRRMQALEEKRLSHLEERLDQLRESVHGENATRGETAAQLSKLQAATEDLVVNARLHAENLAGARQAAHDELQELRSSTEKELKLQIEETLERARAYTDAVAESLSEKIQAELSTARSTVQNLKKELTKGMTARLHEVRKEHAARSEEHVAGIHGVEGVVAKCQDEIQSLRDEAYQATQGMEELRLSLGRHCSDTDATSRRVQQVEASLGRVSAACVSASGGTTKSTEWTIDKADVQLMVDEATQAARGPGLFSPRFDICGVYGLQLELRPEQSTTALAGAVSCDQDGVGGAAEGDAWLDPVPHRLEDCSLYLWGKPGLKLSFSLSLGRESVSLRHTYDSARPFGARRMARLADQLSQEDGCVCVRLEIHEAHVYVPLAADDATATGAGAQGPAQQTAGSLAQLRHVNFSLPGLIQSQFRDQTERLHREVEMLRSRATRRVQWRLEKGTALRQIFGAGKPLCSTTFMAAGMDGLQFVFYPSGCDGAREGHCSFFISCPAGATLRCLLRAGRTHREVHQDPGGTSGLLGKVNFCKFESCVDPVDESVELALEIQEAGQAPETQSTRLTAGQDRVDSCSKVVQQRPAGPGKARHKAAGEEATKRLPAIWTSHGFSSIADLVPAARDSPGRAPQPLGLKMAGPEDRPNTSPYAQHRSSATASLTPRLPRSSPGGLRS